MFKMMPSGAESTAWRRSTALPSWSLVVLPNRTTTTAPSVCDAITAASVTGSSGGVSIRTTSNMPRTRESSSTMALDWRSSAGLGGSRPAASTCSPDSAWVWMTSSRVLCPTRAVVSPTEPSRLSMVCTCGRRRSPSMRSTRCPALTIASAALTAVVDLPSPGTELVTTNALLVLSTSTKLRLVRSTRNASARGACEGSELISGLRWTSLS